MRVRVDEPGNKIQPVSGDFLKPRRASPNMGNTTVFHGDVRAGNDCSVVRVHHVHVVEDNFV